MVLRTKNSSSPDAVICNTPIIARPGCMLRHARQQSHRSPSKRKASPGEEGFPDHDCIQTNASQRYYNLHYASIEITFRVLGLMPKAGLGLGLPPRPTSSKTTTAAKVMGRHGLWV